MKLKKLYEFVIEKGIQEDPRGSILVNKELKELKANYATLSEKQKQGFDLERLKNPFSDTRILHGSGDENIKSILMGIDIDVGEVLLCERLIEKGKKIDLIVAHHPEGRALAALHQVMYMQTDIVHLHGVPITIAEDLINSRISEVERRLLPVNHTKTQDAARLLNLPLMCVHTPADNHVVTFLEKLFKKKDPKTLGEIIDILQTIPEYLHALRNNSGPRIVNGSEVSRTGKIFVDMTGGTEGSKDIYKNLAQAGVGTIVGMHLSEDHLKKAKQEHINVIIAGHISSDNLGLNLILDAIETVQKLDVICCSGFVRVKRK
ncbi:MAG: NGG1p interacting factor NIF3 [Candidatus Omnitrophica bacterium]|nr:NGG1p interacting factor NIF3 [Candidatus Omnitrophota bacterium]